MNRVLLWHWGRRGGGPKYTLDLAEALNARDDIEVVLSVPPQSETYGAALALGVPVIPVATYHNAVSALTALRRVPAVRRQFRAALGVHRIDTVIATMSHLWNPLMVDLFRPIGARLITVIHDAEAHPGEFRPLRRAMIGRELAFSDDIVALSGHVAAGVAAQYGYSVGRIPVIPLGVSRFGVEPNSPRAAPADRPFRFLFFGRLIAYKGLDLLLDAFERIDAAVPVELVIAGSGDLGALKGRIQAMQRVRLDQRWIPEREIQGLLDQADAMVLPYREASQSGVVMTAYGAGLPMVATGVGGLAEQLTAYGAALVAEDLSPAALALAMTRLACDPALYGQMAAAALQAARGHFAWNTIAAQFADLIKRG